MALMLGVAGSLPAQEQADSLAGAAAPQSQPEAVAADAAAALTEAQLWDKANTAYINSDYHKAIDVYEQILARGLGSAKLYYNLGNAYSRRIVSARQFLITNALRDLRRATTTSATTWVWPRR